MYYTEVTNRQEWNTAICQFSYPHILQTYEWGEVKATYGWQPRRILFWEDSTSKPVAAATVLSRQLPGGLGHLLYTPKGPVMNYQNIELSHKVLAQLTTLARQWQAISLKIDPDIAIDETQWYHILANHNFYRAAPVQFRNTVRLQIDKPEEQLLQQMKSKTRYNIRLAKRKGVTIRQAGKEDLEVFYNMYHTTGERNGFSVRPLEYYRLIWEKFMDRGLGKLFLAEVAGEPVAGAYMFWLKNQAWYFYGASVDKYRSYMPTYLLQWRTIQEAKHLGCLYYDFWGAPEIFNHTDPFYGVYRFKIGFGGHTVKQIGAYDYVRLPLRYKLATAVTPTLLKWWHKLRHK